MDGVLPVVDAEGYGQRSKDRLPPPTRQSEASSTVVAGENKTRGDSPHRTRTNSAPIVAASADSRCMRATVSGRRV